MIQSTIALITEISQNLKSNGAFAKVDIPSGTVITHNNGLILSFKEEESMRKNLKDFMKQKSVELLKQNKHQEDILRIVSNDWAKDSKYRTVLPCKHTLEIPHDAGQSNKIYSATKGHKLNHSNY